MAITSSYFWNARVNEIIQPITNIKAAPNLKKPITCVIIMG